MLLEIKHYLIERHQTSLRDLALHFNTDLDAMRGMLEPWINKGKVRKCAAETICGGCSEGCAAASEGEMEVYEWVEHSIKFNAEDGSEVS